MRNPALRRPYLLRRASTWYLRFRLRPFSTRRSESTRTTQNGQFETLPNAWRRAQGTRANVLDAGVALGSLGAVVGLAAAIVLGRLMSSLLFGISPLDPLAYVTAPAVTIAAAAVATCLPARRAAKIDPMNTLRAE